MKKKTVFIFVLSLLLKTIASETTVTSVVDASCSDGKITFCFAGSDGPTEGTINLDFSITGSKVNDAESGSATCTFADDKYTCEISEVTYTESESETEISNDIKL